MEGHVSPDEGDTVPGGGEGRGEEGGKEGLREGGSKGGGEEGGMMEGVKGWRGGGNREVGKRNNRMTADLEMRTAL